MMIIVPKSEADGESVLSVAEAKKQLPKWEMINKLRPNAQNLMNLAAIYYTLGRAEEAMASATSLVEALEEAGDVPPNVMAGVYQNRGMMYRGFGRFDLAQKDIFRAWELEKNSDYIGMAQAEEHLRNGNWPEDGNGTTAPEVLALVLLSRADYRNLVDSGMVKNSPNICLLLTKEELATVSTILATSRFSRKEILAGLSSALTS